MSEESAWAPPHTPVCNILTAAALQLASFMILCVIFYFIASLFWERVCSLQPAAKEAQGPEQRRPLGGGLGPQPRREGRWSTTSAPGEPAGRPGTGAERGPGQLPAGGGDRDTEISLSESLGSVP